MFFGKFLPRISSEILRPNPAKSSFSIIPNILNNPVRIFYSEISVELESFE